MKPKSDGITDRNHRTGIGEKTTFTLRNPMIATIIVGKNEVETDSPWAAAKAVGDAVSRIGDCWVRISVERKLETASTEMPEVRDGGPDKLPDLENGADRVPHKLHKARRKK